MARDIARASTDPDWPRVVAVVERTAVATGIDLARFATQAQSHASGVLTATDLYLAEVEYHRTRRGLRRSVQRAAQLLRRRCTQWDAASLLRAIVAGALDRAAIDPSVGVAIQVDVTQWALEQYDTTPWAGGSARHSAPS